MKIADPIPIATRDHGDVLVEFELAALDERGIDEPCAAWTAPSDEANVVWPGWSNSELHNELFKHLYSVHGVRLSTRRLTVGRRNYVGLGDVAIDLGQRGAIVRFGMDGARWSVPDQDTLDVCGWTMDVYTHALLDALYLQIGVDLYPVEPGQGLIHDDVDETHYPDGGVMYTCQRHQRTWHVASATSSASWGDPCTEEER